MNELQYLKEVKRGQSGYGFLFENDGYVDPTDQKNVLRESLNDSKNEWYIPFPYIVHAVFQKADTPNANGRIYPREILEREIQKFQQKIDERRAYGESDHPDAVVISSKSISMNIIKLWWEGKTVVGDLEIPLSAGYVKYGICSSPGDIIANNVYFNKLKLGVSSRGVGSVENKGGVNVVGQDFELLCWDWVTDPSTPGAWSSKDINDLKPYIESTNVQTDEKKKMIIEKINRVLGIL
jgi:hypothetical protein